MKKLHINAKKIDKFLIKFLKKQKKSLLIQPMKYGIISGGKKIRSTIIFRNFSAPGYSYRNFTLESSQEC